MQRTQYVYGDVQIMSTDKNEVDISWYGTA